MTTRTGSNRMRRGGRIAALTLAAGSLIAGLAGTAASADGPVEVRPTATTCAADEFGSGCFEDYGDHMIVEDYASDGWRIEVRWQTDYGREGVCAIPTGYDYWHCNYDMAEGRELYFEVHRINEKFNLSEEIGYRYVII